MGGMMALRGGGGCWCLILFFGESSWIVVGISSFGEVLRGIGGGFFLLESSNVLVPIRKDVSESHSLFAKLFCKK